MRLKCFLLGCDAVTSAADGVARKRGFLSAAVVALVFGVTAQPSFGQSVVVKDGCVVYTGADGNARRLTDGGKDSEPSLSPDGRRVVFVRATPGRKIDAGSGEAEATELWLAVVGGQDGKSRQDGKDGKLPSALLLRGAASEKIENLLCDFNAPQWAPDGKTIYFLSAAWATSNALHAVDPVTKKARFICAANSLEVVPSGEYRGKLIIQQHRYFLGGGSYDWHYLVEPNGKELGVIGETTENFKDTYLEAKTKP